MISAVTPESVDFVWMSVRPMIQKALRCHAGRHMTEQYYYDAVKAGFMAMWVCHEAEEIIAAGIFSIQNHPAQKVLLVELLAGRNMSAWLDKVEPLLKEYRDLIGATTIEASCRPGLVKKLTRWKVKSTLMELT